MTRLLIANDFSEDLREDRGWAGWWVQRVIWFADDGDTLVLPEPPYDAFFDYVTGLTGVKRDSLTVVVPPPSKRGKALLTPDRLADPTFLQELRAALAGREVECIFPLWPDASVAALARALGCRDALPGYDFLSQGGGVLTNSKTVFRAVAASAGVPVPFGSVCSSVQAAEEQILEMFNLGQHVMLKQDFLSGGRGNEVVTAEEEFRPVGARRTVVLGDRPAVRSYLDRTWEWLSGGGRNRVVVEEYMRDSGAFYGEYLIGDDGVKLTGHGEMLYNPFAVSQLLPTSTLSSEVLDDLVSHGFRLCEAVRTLGYRGYLSGDAIVTPSREVMFTEWNGRVTGATHLYYALGDRVVGNFERDRVLLDSAWPPGWIVDSFEAAVESLHSVGLGYDPESRTGVLLSSALNEDYGTVMHTVVAEDADGAWETERELERLMTPASGQ